MLKGDMNCCSFKKRKLPIKYNYISVACFSENNFNVSLVTAIICLILGRQDYDAINPDFLYMQINESPFENR